jgi:hypothetical protein
LETPKQAKERKMKESPAVKKFVATRFGKTFRILMVPEIGLTKACFTTPFGSYTGRAKCNLKDDAWSEKEGVRRACLRALRKYYAAQARICFSIGNKYLVKVQEVEAMDA